MMFSKGGETVMTPQREVTYVSNRARRFHRLRQIEARYGRPAEEVLADLYMVRRMTTRQVADHLGVSQRQVHRWLVAMGIPRRHQRWDYGEAK